MKSIAPRQGRQSEIVCGLSEPDNRLLEPSLILSLVITGPSIIELTGHDRQA